MKRFLVTFLMLVFVLSVSAFALDKVVISEKGFDEVYASYSDVVVVKNNGLYGAVDRNSNVIVDIKYVAYLLPNKDGVTAFKDKNGNAIVFDKNGRQLAKFSNSGVMGIADGVITLRSGSKITYIELANTANVIATFDNVISATVFNDGYAALKLPEKTVIIDRKGNEVYTDDGGLEPISAVSEGYAMFFTEDEEDFFLSYYIVDIANKKRINITPDPVVSNSSFDVVNRVVKNFNEFFKLHTKDMIEVCMYDGMCILLTEDPSNFTITHNVYINGELSAQLRFLDAYRIGSKYFFVNLTKYDGYFVDMSGNEVEEVTEALIPFTDGRTVLFAEDGGFYFLNENFAPVSETFEGVEWVYSAGNVFYGTKNEKQHIISFSNGSTATPDTPTIPTTPSVTAGMHNFTKVNTYDNTFTDVSGHWSFENVKSAYETGVMLGTTPTTFTPDGKVTVAQLLTMAARLHSIYNTGKAEFVQGSVWYQVYVDYCLRNSIITTSTFDKYDREATRAEVARVMAKTFPSSEFVLKNDINEIPDVPRTNPDFDAILKLYRSGIVTGKVGLDFKPDDFIKRSEMSAILTRIIDSTLRKKV